MDATLQDPLVGRLLDGRYEVSARIARGGMATVYLAHDRRLGRDVALKVLHGHLAGDSEFIARFVREARSAARLSHPNVVQVFDQGEDDGVLYLAMEHLPGRTLRDVLTQRGALSPRDALSVLEPVLDALATAHRSGLVHRDIKPENVILTDDGRIKVADFGLARAATASAATSSVLMGTVGYLAPELVAHGIADTRSDVYAIGVMVFEMLTGRQPFTGDVPIQVAYRHVNEDVPAPSSVVPTLPLVLDHFVTASTARDPDQRPSSAVELLAMLREIRAQLPAAAMDALAPVTPARHAHPPLDHHPTQEFQALAFDEPVFHDQRGFQDTVALDGAAGVEDVAAREQARRRRLNAAGGVLLGLVVALALAGGAWWFASGPGAVTTTPRLTGLTQAQAVQQLRAKDLSAALTIVFSEAPPGTVVRTDPAAGDSVRKQGTVRLFVSKGPDVVPVPTLAGKTLDEAKAALAKARLTLGTTSNVYDDATEAGRVVSSAPQAGQKARRGSTVSLTISKGAQPIEVPDLSNVKQDQALSQLSGMQLEGQIRQDFSDTVEAGNVISQDPSPGTTVAPGTTITLVISKGPQLVAVPRVIGLPFDQAKLELEALGLVVDERKVLGGFFGTVRSQDPAEGTMVPPGTTISLLVI